MSWIKTSWIDVIGTSLVKTTINASSSGNGETATYIEMTIRAAITFGGSTPKGNAIINIYNIDRSDGGSNVADTKPIITKVVKKELSSEVIITMPNIKTLSLDYLKIEVVNEDVNDSIDVHVSVIGSREE